MKLQKCCPIREIRPIPETTTRTKRHKRHLAVATSTNRRVGKSDETSEPWRKGRPYGRERHSPSSAICAWLSLLPQNKLRRAQKPATELCTEWINVLPPFLVVVVRCFRNGFLPGNGGRGERCSHTPPLTFRRSPPLRGQFRAFSFSFACLSWFFFSLYPPSLFVVSGARPPDESTRHEMSGWGRRDCCLVCWCASFAFEQ